MVVKLLGLNESGKLSCELCLRYFIVKLVNGLNKSDFFFLIKWVFKCGIDIGGVLIFVLL